MLDVKKHVEVLLNKVSSDAVSDTTGGDSSNADCPKWAQIKFSQKRKRICHNLLFAKPLCREERGLG